MPQMRIHTQSLMHDCKDRFKNHSGGYVWIIKVLENGLGAVWRKAMAWSCEGFLRRRHALLNRGRGFRPWSIINVTRRDSTIIADG
jgi:hypothetical protein